MSLPKSLADHIAALASETPDFDGKSRVLNAHQALESILVEIDMAVLPIALRFEGGSATLTCLVNGRRLHQITEGAPDTIAGQALDPDDTDMTRAAAEVLRDFAQQSSTLKVTHLAPPSDAGDMSDRVSVRALESALGLVRDNPNAPLPERFITRLGDALTAAITLKNRKADSTLGPATEVATLKIVLSTQLAPFLETRYNKCASHIDPSLTVFADVTEPGVSLGIVIFDSETVLFSCPTTALSRAHDAFRRLKN